MKKLKFLLIGLFVISFTLLITSCNRNEPNKNINESHSHSYLLKYDSEKHWQECMCGSKIDEKNHEFGEWRIPNEPTTQGTKERECSICQYLDIDIPKKEFTIGLEYELNLSGIGYSIVGIGEVKDLHVIIPNTYNGLPVTSIASNAFRNSKLIGVEIPKSVTSIGYEAFKGCHSLTSITLPFIGASTKDNKNNDFGYIFGGFTNVPSSLKEVTITGEISIASQAFMNQINLTNVTIGDNVISVGAKAFYGCRNLTSVTIGNRVTSIEDEAFSYCSNLKSITLGNGLTSIGKSVFYHCNSLQSIVIPNSLKIIEESAFNCYGSIKEVFYKGTIADWDNIKIEEWNTPLTNAIRYYYLETKPLKEGNYWHYVAGVTTKW